MFPLTVVFTHIYTPASLVAQTVKNLPVMQETKVQSLGREDSLGDDPLQYSCWWPTVHGVAESDVTERRVTLYMHIISYFLYHLTVCVWVLF